MVKHSPTEVVLDNVLANDSELLVIVGNVFIVLVLYLMGFVVCDNELIIFSTFVKIILDEGRIVVDVSGMRFVDVFVLSKLIKIVFDEGGIVVVGGTRISPY